MSARQGSHCIPPGECREPPSPAIPPAYRPPQTFGFRLLFEQSVKRGSRDVTLDHVAGGFGRVTGRQIRRNPQPGSHAIDVRYVANLDGKACLAKMLNPTATASAIGVFSDDDGRARSYADPTACKECEGRQSREDAAAANHYFGISIGGLGNTSGTWSLT